MTSLRPTMLALSLPVVAVAVVGCSSSKPAASTGTTTPSDADGTSSTAPSSTGTSAPSTTVVSGPGQVAIVDFDFVPTSITVASGATVTWTNQDASDHWVVSAPTSPASFDLGRQSDAAVVSHAFTAPGTYPYFCNLHNYMKGEVVVS